MPVEDAHKLQARDIKSFTSFGEYLVRQLLATAILSTAGTIVTFMLWAILIEVLYQYGSHTFAINNSLLGVLGTLISFAVSLRASSGYERHTEGRRLWGSMQLSLRNMASLIWIHLQVPNADKMDDEEREDAELKLMLEKRAMLKLVTAFPYAVKHALRHEPGPFHEDLFDLIHAMPKYAHYGRSKNKMYGNSALPTPAISTTPQLSGEYIQATPAAESSQSSSDLHGKIDANGHLEGDMATPCPELQPGFCPPQKTVYDHVPVLYILRPFFYKIFKVSRTKEQEIQHELNKRRKERAMAEANIVIEISLTLSSYIRSVSDRGLADGVYSAEMLAAYAQINDQFANLERILTSPLPYTFNVHLRLIVYIYLILLPFQIVATYGYLSILFEAVTAFFFEGFLWVGSAVENPFGYDDGDLNLDLFCAVTAAEIAEITLHPPRSRFEEILEHPSNCPLQTTGDLRSAKDIIAQHRAENSGEMREKLEKSHRNELRRRLGMIQRFKHRSEEVQTPPLSAEDRRTV